MEKVKIGLIGLGLMGSPHARVLKKVPECDLVAASDVDEKQKEVADEVGAKFYRRYEEMIEKEKSPRGHHRYPESSPYTYWYHLRPEGLTSFCREAYCSKRLRGGPPD